VWRKAFRPRGLEAGCERRRSAAYVSFAGRLNPAMSDHFAPQTRTSDQAAAPLGLSLRAVLLALALCVLLNFLGARSYILVDRYNGFTDHFNTVGVIFVLFLVTAVSAAVGRPPPARQGAGKSGPAARRTDGDLRGFDGGLHRSHHGSGRVSLRVDDRALVLRDA